MDKTVHVRPSAENPVRQILNAVIDGIDRDSRYRGDYSIDWVTFAMDLYGPDRWDHGMRKIVGTVDSNGIWRATFSVSP